MSTHLTKQGCEDQQNATPPNSSSKSHPEVASCWKYMTKPLACSWVYHSYSTSNLKAPVRVALCTVTLVLYSTENELLEPDHPKIWKGISSSKTIFGMFQPSTFQENILKMSIHSYCFTISNEPTNSYTYMSSVGFIYVFFRNQASLGIVADADSRAGFIDFDSVPKVPFVWRKIMAGQPGPRLNVPHSEIRA